MIPIIKKDPTGIENVNYLRNYWNKFRSTSAHLGDDRWLRKNMIEPQHKLTDREEAKES